MVKTLIEITLDKAGIVEITGRKKRPSLKAIPLGNPIIINAYLEDMDTTKEIIRDYAPLKASAYTIGQSHPKHIDYHPVQYYKLIKR
ncbi:hypothetical protein HYW75_01225 [Candidatus Pacearchaeota archaeon]|nr:hypothetical protein [Candidatus Pacearchaeota archaeon]